jgi:hypothetical protein
MAMNLTLDEGCALPSYEMSEERLSAFESKLKILDRVTKLGYVLIFGAFALGGWVATLQSRINNHGEALPLHEKRLTDLEHFRVLVQETRFTAADSQRLLNPITEAIVNQDKRITRMEDSQLRIEKALDRIEQKLPKP